MARSWRSRLNPFAWVQRWFTIGAVLWLIGTTTLLTAAITREGVTLSVFFAIYLLLTVTCSVIAFILYGIDKRRAIKNQSRIPERTLHILSALGGWPGAHLAQRIFHHKTLKISFRFVFWATVLVHLTIIAYGVWTGWPITLFKALIKFSESP